jgi:hypothetical protein
MARELKIPKMGLVGGAITTEHFGIGAGGGLRKRKKNYLGADAEEGDLSNSSDEEHAGEFQFNKRRKLGLFGGPKKGPS